MTILLTVEQGRELRSLYERLPAAVQEAVNAIPSHGMDSREFRDADRRVGEIFARIREIYGE